VTSEEYWNLFNAFLSSYEPDSVSGKLTPSIIDQEDLCQMNPDDVESMDLQWGYGNTG
jgi:hypothetical protein